MGCASHVLCAGLNFTSPGLSQLKMGPLLVQWVSGASDGSLAVWSQMKKRPVSIIKHAHAAPASKANGGPAAMDSDAASWVQSVAACQGSDLVVSLCSVIASQYDAAWAF